MTSSPRAHKKDIPHPSCPQPPQGAELWRYLTLEKFERLIASPTLYLRRVDQLDDMDRFEGSVPISAHEFLKRRAVQYFRTSKPELVAGLSTEEQEELALQLVRATRHAMRRGAYVSCWSVSAESEAMWRVYAKENGVAIVTTTELLRESLAPDPKARLATVTYVDYSSGKLAHENDLLAPLTHKRLAFGYEQAVRILRWSREDTVMLKPNETPPPRPIHISFPWDIGKVATRIVDTD